MPNDPNPSDSEGGPDGEYSWNGGEAPDLGAYDSPNYREDSAVLGVSSLIEAFSDYCEGQGAYEPTLEQKKHGVLGACAYHFTHQFATRFTAIEDHPAYNIKRSVEHGGIVEHCVRVDQNEERIFVLAYSLKPATRTFLLPTAIAYSSHQPQLPWGQIRMDLVESLTPFSDSAGAAGMVTQISISEIDSQFNAIPPAPFLTGPSKELSFEHIEDLAECVRGERSERHSPWVNHLPASIVVAFALTEIAKREPILMGITGVDLSDSRNLLTIGVAVLNEQPTYSRSIFEPPAVMTRGYRFTLDSDHQAIVLPRFLDCNGSSFR